MQYDFDQVVDRSKNLSAKYDERVKKFGTDDVIPLWIADMDFRTAQPVIDALKARAEEGIWGYTARPASYFEAVKNWQKRRNNAFSVTAMEVAFNEGEEWLEQLLPYISANFDFVVDYCEKHIPKIRTYAPDATYLMWLDCRDLGLSNEALHDFMIQKAKLGLNDGCAFGRSLNGYMRLNVACPRSILEQAMRQLEAAVNSL